MIPTITLQPQLIKTMGTATAEIDEREDLSNALRQCADLLDQNEDISLVAIILDGKFVEFVFDGLEQICYG